MVANLDQNPARRPILGSWLPALLRQGTMFRMNIGVGLGLGSSGAAEERWLLDSVTGLCSCRRLIA